MAHNVVTIYGMPGCGKTTLARKIWSYDHHHGAVTIACDPTLPGRDNLYLRIEDSEYRIRDAVFCNTREMAEKALASGARTVVLRPLTKLEKPRVVAAIQGMLSDPLRGACYIVDESHLTVPNVTMHYPTGVESTLEEARNYDIRVTLICKRPQHISVRARQYTTNACVMHQDSEGAISGLKESMDPRLARGATKLPWGEYLYRPPFREDDEKPLEKKHVMHDPIPWPPHRKCGNEGCKPCARR